MQEEKYENYERPMKRSAMRCWLWLVVSKNENSVCVRAYMRTCIRACVRVCVCVDGYLPSYMI